MPKKTKPEILPLDQASMRHFGEWVLLEVTNWDENGAISHGQVLKASKSRAAISKALLRAHQEDPQVHTYLFVGGERKVTGDELRAALRRVAEEDGYVNARW